MKGRRRQVAVMPKEKIDKNTITRLLKLIGQNNKKKWIIVFISIVISTAVSVSSAFFLEFLIDDYIGPLVLSDIPNYAPLFKYLLIMLAVFLVGIVFNYVYNRLMIVISQTVLKDIRDEMFEHMQTLPIRFFDTHQHGDVMSYYTNDVETLGQMISNGIPTIVQSILSIVLILFSMIYQNIILTAIALFGVVLMILSTKNVAEKASKFFESQQTSTAKLNGFVEEMIEGQKVIKVFTHEDIVKEQFNEYNEKLCDDTYQAERLANIIGPVSNNVGHIIYVIIAIVGGAMTIKGFGGMTIGVVAAFLQLVRNFTNPISQVTQQMSVLFQALAGAKRIFSLIDEESEKDEGIVTLVKTGTNEWAWNYPKEDGTFDLIELKGDVRFFDVNFGYDKKKEVLHNISLYAKPGQKIAFVGSTGAGKTTITNLINRFYDIKEGKITYDGIDVNLIRKQDLRLSLGMVLQDTNLFTGTIRDNISYGNDSATLEDIIAAAKLANADEFIRLLPDGYDTVISGNSAEISQGQKQLLSIARVALVNPPVMILDEATSSIDSRTERIVQKGMDSLMDGRTVFVIAHRLSTVQNSKAIMVLENGKIIERGSHEELIEQKGTYYRLYTGAFELE